MTKAQSPFPRVMTEPFALNGGLDLTTPALFLKPGFLIDALNYEPDINGGYRRMYGNERLDGRPSPSAANYYVTESVLTGVVVVGNTITGSVSGATAVVLQVNGTTELILTKIVGTFVEEGIIVGGFPVGTIGLLAMNGASTPILHATYKSLAANNYRADIQKVPGSGPVLGVWYFQGNFYAFRDNAGATAGGMWKSSAAGWVAVPLGRTIGFTASVGQIFDGDTVTGGTSGATAVVKRALLRTNTWPAGGIGTLVFTSVTGAFISGEPLKVSGVTKATSSSADTATTLLPGGRYQFANTNFAGTVATYRMYGCDGKNLMFEFDGTNYVPIPTGILDDAPKFICAWRNMLVCAVESSVQVSGIGQPYSWTALTGAAELALGNTVTGLLAQTGNNTTGALCIGAGSSTGYKTFILYGTSIADFNLVESSPEAGPIPYTMQNIGLAYYLDTKGVVQINTTQSFGNFEMATITRIIQPLIDSKRGLAVASCVVKATNQYRVFFSDGTAIIIYMIGGENKYTGSQLATVGGITPFIVSPLGEMYFNTAESIVDVNGIERIIASGSDGYVYEAERGTSLDGQNIESHLMLAFNSNNSPRNRKKYLRTVIQAICANTADVNIGYELNFGSNETDSGYRAGQTLLGAGGYFDIFTWDQFSWDSPFVTDYIIDTPGNGRNIGMLIYGDTAIDEPYTIQSAIMHYTIGRLER